MYIGRFDDNIMPLTKKETQKYINVLKKHLKKDEAHGFSNFEIV